MVRPIPARPAARVLSYAIALQTVAVLAAHAGPGGGGSSGGAAPPPQVLHVEPVVVTATKRETPADRVGSSVTVIEGEELRRGESRDVLEALRDVPGVSVVQTGGRGGPTSLFVRGGESDHNLVLVDGVQVNFGGGAFDFANLTSDGVDRVEIVRGPLSALYGSDALASAIHIRTRRGSEESGGRLAFEAGTHRTFEESASVSGGGDRLGYTLAFGRHDTDGIERRNDEAESTTARLRADWTPIDRAALGLTAWYTDAELGEPADFVSGVRGGFPPVDPNQESTARDLILGVDGAVEASEHWEHHWQLGYTDRRQRFRDELDPIPSDFSDSEFETRERRFSADYRQLVRVPMGRLARGVLTLGVEWESQRFRQETESRMPGSPATFERVEAARRTLAPYAQAEVALGERLFLTGGARIDGNSEYGTVVSPVGSAVLRISEHALRLHASVGRGFKEPTFLETFGSSFVAGNPDLDPERSLSFEVGVDQTLWDGRIEWFATAFETRFEDLIAFTGSFGTPDVGFENVQRARSRGVELGFRVRVTRRLQAGLSYTHLRTKVVDGGGLDSSGFEPGEPLLRRPAHSGSFFVDFRSESLEARLSGTLVGSRIDRDFGVFPEERVRNPGYVKLDLSASYPVYHHAGTGAELRLRGVVENLLDDDFEEAFGIRSPGIEARGGVELRF